MGRPGNHFLRIVGVFLAFLYVMLVAALAGLKAERSLVVPLSWAEVIGGPALGIASAFGLVALGVWIEGRVRSGTARRSDGAGDRRSLPVDAAGAESGTGRL